MYSSLSGSCTVTSKYILCLLINYKLEYMSPSHLTHAMQIEGTKIYVVWMTKITNDRKQYNMVRSSLIAWRGSKSWNLGNIPQCLGHFVYPQTCFCWNPIFSLFAHRTPARCLCVCAHAHMGSGGEGKCYNEREKERKRRENLGINIDWSFYHGNFNINILPN